MLLTVGFAPGTDAAGQIGNGQAPAPVAAHASQPLQASQTPQMTLVAEATQAAPAPQASQSPPASQAPQIAQASPQATEPAPQTSPASQASQTPQAPQASPAPQAPQASPAPQAPQAAQGWFGRQLSTFKGYPHLDMAYRRIREGKPAEAVPEFERYLQIKPDDSKARSDYLNLLFTLRRYGQALAEARRLLAATPDNPDILLTLARCLVNTGEAKAAVEPLQKAVALTRNDAPRHRTAVLAAAELLGQLGRQTEALALLDGLPATPGDFTLLQTKGMLLAKNNESAKAGQAFAAALAAAGNATDKLAALRALGVTATTLGEYDKAQHSLEKARELDPKDPDIVRNLAVLATKRNDAKEAIRLGRRLTAMAPTPDNREFLANLLASAKDYDAAIAELQAVRQADLAPEAAFRLEMRLGMLYLDAGKPDQAAATLRQAVARRPDPLALVRLSRALRQAGQPQEAATALEQAVAHGADPDTRVELATLLGQLDKQAAALASLDQALAQSPSPAQRRRILTMQATLLEEQGRDGAARQALEQAIAITGPDQARLLASLGEICLRQADVPAAVTAFSRAVAAGAGDDAQLALAQALVKNGQPEEALRLFTALADKAGPATQRNAARLGQANLLARLGRNAEAARIYATLAETGPPELWRQAGQSYAAARENPQAAAALRAFADKAQAQNDKAEGLLALGRVYASQGKAAQAYDAFSQAASLAGDLAPDVQAEIALGRGTSATLAGKPAQAVEPLRQATALLPNGPKKARALLTLAQAYDRLGDTAKAASTWRQAAAQPGATRADVASAEESLGYALDKAGDQAGAEAAFRRSLALHGANWRMRFALGQIEYASGRYQEALEDFFKSLALHPDPATRLGIGRTYDKLGKPGLALVAFGQAAPALAGMSPEQQRELHQAEGFLRAAEFRYDAAVDAFKAAQDIRFDPHIAVRLGRLERLAGRPDEAKQTLTAVDPATLPRELRVLRLSELASLAEAAKEYPAARELLKASLAEGPDADIFFRLGNVERDTGNAKEAVAAYRQAVVLEDANRYRTALGYALVATHHYAEAARIFETVLASDKDYLPLWEDLGYAYMHECDNAKAIDRFKQAIDNAPYRPVDNEADRKQRDKDVYRLRKEVTKLETHLTATAYLSYIAGDAGPMPSSGGTSVDTIRSGAGAEFAWIPPVIGFRDDRILQIIGRVTTNLDKDTLELDDKSWQGAVGLRYKPLKSQNLNVGFERLFKIGRSAEENWLLRGMYSWTDGYDVKPGETWWNYTFFYGEYDYYLEKDQRSMFYAEGRQGITFNLGDRFLLTPHLVADVRIWSPDRDESSCVEGGGGLSLKHIFNRSDYEVERSSLEFLLQYKFGTLFNKTKVTDRENVINALYLTTILKF